MTQVKLWQIVSQNANGIIFSDANGNLKTLEAGGGQKVLVSGPDGSPMWAENSALVAALEAQTDAANALATAKAYTESQIAALVDNAPVALDTLNELAQKLNGEDSAINALLLQVDGKAEKTAVDTIVAQAKQDTLDDSKVYTDNAVTNMMTGFNSQVNGAKNDILAQAAADASFKATTAKTEAIEQANGYTEQLVAASITDAGQNAYNVAEAARINAVAEAHTYTDNRIAELAANSSNEAQVKAEIAQNNAAVDASEKVDGLRNSIAATFQVEGTSTACFLASSLTLDQSTAVNEGLTVVSSFTEVTGANIQPNDSTLNAKLLFINGVAISSEWATTKIGNGQLVITMSERLAGYLFDGAENAVMILAEYKSYNPISRIS